jgi:hypothetical protein
MECGLRPAISVAREGEHSAVVWKLLKRRPFSVIRPPLFGILVALGDDATETLDMLDLDAVFIRAEGRLAYGLTFRISDGRCLLLVGQAGGQRHHGQ